LGGKTPRLKDTRSDFELEPNDGKSNTNYNNIFYFEIYAKYLLQTIKQTHLMQIGYIQNNLFLNFERFRDEIPFKRHIRCPSKIKMCMHR